MIARISGTVVESSCSGCVVDVNGVGYELAIPLSTFEKLPLPGGSVVLQVYTQVREDAISLFGFASVEEKELFKKLINVSGIGGKLAMSILSSMPVGAFCTAVATSDVKLLGRINGIGKRTAERLVVELKGKLTADGKSSVFEAVPGASAAAGALSDAALALEQLGFKRDAIDRTLKELDSELKEEEKSADNLLRKAIIRLNF